MTARVLSPADPGYDDLRRPANPRFAHLRPAAIARCHSADDVAVALAGAGDRRTAVRAGGHSFAGHSSTEGVLIDVRPMNGVAVTGGRVIIGAGALLGDIYDVLAGHGRTIPAGCGPTVGIAGLTLGGGLGILGRTYGLTCDSLRAATVVLADGRTVRCDDDHEPDLFWLLRGGGAPGVVTELVFATVPAPESTAFRLMFPATGAADVLDAWQRYAPEAGDGLAASLVLSTSADPEWPAAVAVSGAVLGSAAAGTHAIDELTAALGVPPVSGVRRHGTHRETKRLLAGLSPHDGPEPDDGFAYLRSEYFSDRVPAADLVSGLIQERRPGESRELDFSPWAGAYNRVAADATAFPHRNARFLLKHSVTVAGGTDPADATAWLETSYAITHPYGTGGAYPNFPEPGQDEARYYCGNTARVRQIRAAYDPDGRFGAEEH